MLTALLGATAGQGVVWYTGQFYVLFFLTITLKVDLLLAYGMVGMSLLIGAPFFVLFGWLSDRIGRLKLILCRVPYCSGHLHPVVSDAGQIREP